MPDQFTTTQYGAQNQPIGFKGAQAGAQNDIGFQQRAEADLLNKFGMSVGMSGIAGAGKLAAFMKTPQGQQAFAAFKAKNAAPKPAAPPPGAVGGTPTPPNPQMGAPTPAPSPTPRISQLAPQPPGAMVQPPQPGLNLGANTGNPYIQNLGGQG